MADETTDVFTYVPTPTDESDAAIMEKVALQLEGLGETVPMSKLGSNLFTVSAGIAKILRSAKSLPSMAAEIAHLRGKLDAARAVYDKYEHGPHYGSEVTSFCVDLAGALGISKVLPPTIASRADAEAEAALEEAALEKALPSESRV